MNRDELLTFLRRFKEEYHTQFDIHRIGIFGSLASNSAGPPNDIDVVVELEKPDMFCLIGIKQDLEALFNMPVDIVRYRKNMNKYLKERIDTDAVYV